MMRTVRNIIFAISLLPVTATANEPAPDRELVAEALFLCDTLPPGGRDLNLSVAFAQGEPDPATGETSLAASPRLQLALALGERLGFTADVGFASNGSVIDAPGASLKYLVRAPDGGRTGLSASLDVFGSTHSLDGTEAGLAIGAIRALGRVALRAGVALASGVASWSPHVHAGASAAVAVGGRWRFLGEVVTDVSDADATVAAGPTVKVTLGERTALMAGALFEVSPAAATPTFTVQLTRSL